MGRLCGVNMLGKPLISANSLNHCATAVMDGEVPLASLS